jgi:hypothetical protein
MDERVVLIAGEVDGRELVLHQPLDRIRIPGRVHPTWVAEYDDGPVERLPVLDYDLVLDELGYPSRDDQGRLRYQLQSPLKISNAKK